jgi:hypothetical protein
MGKSSLYRQRFSIPESYRWVPPAVPRRALHVAPPRIRFASAAPSCNVLENDAMHADCKPRHGTDPSTLVIRVSIEIGYSENFERTSVSRVTIS